MRPVREQPTEVSQRLPEGAELPIKHRAHTAVSRGGDHVLHVVVPVYESQFLLLGHRCREPFSQLVDRRQIPRARLLPLAMPALQLSRGVGPVAREGYQSGGLQIHGVDAREGFDEREANRATACGGQRPRRRLVVEHKSLHVLHRQHRYVAELALGEADETRYGHGRRLKRGEDPALACDIVRGGQQMPQRRASQYVAAAVGICHEEGQVRMPMADAGALQGRARIETEREQPRIDSIEVESDDAWIGGSRWVHHGIVARQAAAARGGGSVRGEAFGRAGLG